MLTDTQKRSFEQEGYLLLERWVNPDWLEQLQTASDRHVERSRALTVSGQGLDLEPDHTANQPRLRRLVSPVDHDETFRAFALEGPAAQLAQLILGGPVRFHHSKLNYKWSGGGEEVKWHQDIQFWPHTDFSPLTIGVYLDDVDAAMGPMGIIPRSHEGHLFDQYNDEDRWLGSIRDQDLERLNLEDVRWLSGPAGSVTVHHCCAVHGSMPNHSPRVRRLLLQTYSRADAYPIKNIGANGNLGRFGGLLIGGDNEQTLSIEGRVFRGAPDWSGGRVPTIFASQQSENN